jgi:hypothetical protein
MSEMWKVIEGYNGNFQVSNMGQVKRTILTNKKHIGILKPNDMNNGYSYVVLYTDGKSKSCLIHRLVAEAFVPNPLNKPVVSHLDGNTRNNCADNLVWLTRQEVVDKCKEEGRFRKGDNSKKQPTIDHMRLLWERGYNKREIAQIVGASPETVHKYLKEAQEGI